MLHYLNHPHIVKLYDSAELSVKEEKYGFLFMENCGNG
jgi:serine/threonine protein kinase